MREKINEEVGVIMYYSAKHRKALLHTISWRNREYFIGKIGYQHPVRDGRTLHHVFELIDRDEKLWFRLNFNTDNLHWTLEAVSDGLAN